MHRVNHLVNHLSVQGCGNTNKDEITSLDVFTIMNAILNNGKGGGINESALKDEKKLRQVFDKLDLNSSGDLDKNEFSKAARLVSMTITDDEIDTIYNKMAKDGTIKFEQFQLGISSLLDTISSNIEKFNQLDEDKRLVIALWDQYMNNNRYASNVFTYNLLQDNALKSIRNVDLTRQVHMVYGMVCNAFRGLFDEDKLIKRLNIEGRRHYHTYGLTTKHYNAVTKALFLTLPQVMGKEYTYYVQMQFEKNWELIKNAMVKGYVKSTIVM